MDELLVELLLSLLLFIIVQYKTYGRIIIIIIIIFIIIFFLTARDKEPIIIFMGLEEDKDSNTAIVGSNVNLTCIIHNPQILNTFEKNGRDLDEDKDYTYYNFGDDEDKRKRSVLEIKNVTLEDAGNYTCVAFREGATTRITFYLKVGAYSN